MTFVMFIIASAFFSKSLLSSITIVSCSFISLCGRKIKKKSCCSKYKLHQHFSLLFPPLRSTMFQQVSPRDPNKLRPVEWTAIQVVYTVNTRIC